jgi:hypothetical protein
VEVAASPAKLSRKAKVVEAEVEAVVTASPAKRGRKAKVVVEEAAVEAAASPARRGRKAQLVEEATVEAVASPARRGRKAKVVEEATVEVASTQLGSPLRAEPEPVVEIVPLKKGRGKKATAKVVEEVEVEEPVVADA